MNEEANTPQKSEPEQAQQASKLDYTALRTAAERKFTERLRGLHHLVKVSKGKGTPTLQEITEMHSAASALFKAQQLEVQELSRTLTTLLVNVSLRVDAIIHILKEKEIVSGDDGLKEALNTILQSQRAQVEEAKQKMLEASMKQAGETKQP